MSSTATEPEPKGCWAKCLGNCSQKMSREHTISQGLFNTDEIMVQGFPWCLDEPKCIGLANLVKKILCTAHNNALGELDDAAKRAFDVFREAVRLNNVRQKIKRPPVWNVKRLTIDGPQLERWFLKTLINLSFRGQWTIGVGAHLAGSVSSELVETAFGLRKFEPGAGMYTIARAGQQMDSTDRVNFTPLTLGSGLYAARFIFRGHTFFLNLLPQQFKMDGDSYLLYRNVTHNWDVKGRRSHVISIAGWSEEEVRVGSARQPRLCYLCGRSEEELGGAKLTSDHVIADGFFPKPKPENLLTLPCCEDCQKEYRMDEEYVRNSLTAISNVGANMDALYAWKAAHRALLRRPAVNTDFRGRISPVEVHGAKQLGLYFSKPRTEKVIRKIGLGLHYFSTGLRVPSDFETQIFYQPDTLLEEMLKYARHRGYYGDTFSYAGAVSHDGASMWWMSFYASVLFIVIFLPPNDTKEPKEVEAGENA
jgi:hypothetical protein